jgi:hypothetical protein
MQTDQFLCHAVLAALGIDPFVKLKTMMASLSANRRKALVYWLICRTRDPALRVRLPTKTMYTNA